MQAQLAPATPQPPYPRPDDSQRWWLLTMMAVVLPAVLTAAVPRITQRTIR
ncbi:hypothetical protein [Streptantibioticus ferralitis]|uniref:Uncharacterized protein n=1 Tax=Streptantibioticus ferralitis TaxID=236510 RepID=A0ABT5Z9G3_9ACTN|nr:hypothetical protein [Streptantibioticus ferralitis]MDF2260450.1 hypothetical protein [Streptantibioticus ferralitis]